MRPGRLAFAAGLVLVLAVSVPALSQVSLRTPPPPDHATRPTATGQQPAPLPAVRHADLMARYKSAKTESLAQLTTSVQKPKPSMTPVQAQQVVDRHVEAAVRYLHTIMRDPRVQNELGKMRRKEAVAAFVKRQMAQWEYLRRLARDALDLQVEMLKKREALQKAIEDSPQQIAAFVEELQAAEDKIKDYLKAAGARIDQRKRERTVQFVETVVGNVQSAWGNLLTAHKEFMDKKQFKPATYKKRADKLKARVPDPTQHPTQPPEEFAQTATSIKASVGKGYKGYKKTHAAATDARRPLTTGSAAHSVGTFKGAKPDQLLPTARERMKRHLPPVPPGIKRD